MTQQKVNQTIMASALPDFGECDEHMSQTYQKGFVFNRIKRLKREELEQIVMNYMARNVTSFGPLLNMEKEIETYKKKNQSMQHNIDELNQEITSLSAVLRMFVSQANKAKTAQPIKTSRSVGVQVQTLVVNDVKKYESMTKNVNSQQSSAININDKNIAEIPNSLPSTAHHKTVQKSRSSGVQKNFRIN